MEILDPTAFATYKKTKNLKPYSQLDSVWDEETGTTFKGHVSGLYNKFHPSLNCSPRVKDENSGGLKNK